MALQTQYPSDTQTIGGSLNVPAAYSMSIHTERVQVSPYGSAAGLGAYK